MFCGTISLYVQLITWVESQLRWEYFDARELHVSILYVPFGPLQTNRGVLTATSSNCLCADG